MDFDQRGSLAYFLPDMEIEGESGKLCADLLQDGKIVEMKNDTAKGIEAALRAVLSYIFGKVYVSPAP